MIAVVGEAWGEEEEKEGRPFVGRAGQQLDRLLVAAGIDRNTCWIGNVVNARPPANDFGVYYENKTRTKPKPELVAAQQELVDTLVGLNPDVVIALGNEALTALTDLRGIEKWRGSILWGKGGLKVVPTFHPSAILRGVGGAGDEMVKSHWYLPAAIFDMKRAASEVGKDFPVMPEVEIVRDASKLRELLESWRGKKVALDIEVSYEYRGEEMSCIGFASEAGKAHVVPVIDAEGVHVLSPDVYAEVVSLVREFFASTEIAKIGQNIQFDINVLRRTGIIDAVNNLWMDTLVAHSNAVQPEFPHDLGFLCSWYTRYPYYKFMKTESGEELWKYNGYDAAATLEVALALEEEMKRFRTHEFYHNYIHKLIMPLADMNLGGIHVDKEYQKVLKKEIKADIETLKQTLLQLTNGKIVNHRSPKQISEYLYTDRGYDRPARGSSTGTAEIALKNLLRKTGDKCLATLISLRELEKQASSYANVATARDGTVRTMYLFTKTGRLRSGRYDE